MKKITLIAALIASLGMNAQTAEVKINPIGALFGNIALSGEYFVSDNFGAELTLGLITGSYGAGDIGSFEAKKSGFGVMGMGKYYFSPDDVCDKFFGAVYLRQRSFEITADEVDGDEFAAWKRSIFAGGIALGYKWASTEGICLEIAFGGGRAFVENNEWSDSNNEGESFPDLGVDFISRLAVGYRF